jgi:hypothetical protein
VVVECAKKEKRKKVGGWFVITFAAKWIAVLLSLLHTKHNQMALMIIIEQSSMFIPNSPIEFG